MPFKFGILEIIVIIIIIFIIFGAGKSPQLIEMFGKWRNDFKKTVPMIPRPK